MRVFIPGTTTILRGVLDTGGLQADGDDPLTGFAVTSAVRERYTDGNEEELEYVALLLAARGSLRLLDLDPGSVRRRVVLAVEVPPSDVTVIDDVEPGAVRVSRTVAMSDIASVHVDDADAEDAVRAAARVMIEADLGDESAEQIVEDTEGFELSWYANQEIGALLELG